MSQMPQGYIALYKCDDTQPHEHHLHGGKEPGTRPLYCLGVPGITSAIADEGDDR